MNTSLHSLYKRIDSLKTELDALRPLDSEQEQRLLQRIRLSWNYHSNKIEGNSLTFGETKALILWGITADGKPLRDHLEIRGHNQAVDYILDVLKGNEIEITEHFIRGLHKIILPDEYFIDARTYNGSTIKKKITPGEYKKLNNSVLTSTGEIIYFASPEDTPSMMKDLIEWLRHEEVQRTAHPLYIASMFHYRFVRIHPFDDGNGRMSRLLMNLLLMKFGFPPVIIKIESRKEYLNSLQYADSAEFSMFEEFIGINLIDSLQLWILAAKGNIEDFESFS